MVVVVAAELAIALFGSMTAVAAALWVFVIVVEKGNWESGGEEEGEKEGLESEESDEFIIFKLNQIKEVFCRKRRFGGPGQRAN